MPACTINISFWNINVTVTDTAIVAIITMSINHFFSSSSSVVGTARPVTLCLSSCCSTGATTSTTRLT
jgi:hypothetical protein